MTTLTLAKLAEIETAAAKATPGPWSWDGKVWNYDSEQEAPWLISGMQKVITGEIHCNEANATLIALCDPATVAALCNAYRERDALAAQLTGYDAAREMLNVQDNKIDKLLAVLGFARNCIYSLDAREIYADELARIDAALAKENNNG